MIKVEQNRDWVHEHIAKELNLDEALFQEVQDFADVKNIGVGDIYDLYYDGLCEGIENGEYLSFADWFREYTAEY